MSNILNPKVNIPTPPPAPETPPAATINDNIAEEMKKLNKKKGDKANLMTGGLGLSSIPKQNLYAHTLGGYSPMGVNNG